MNVGVRLEIGVLGVGWFFWIDILGFDFKYVEGFFFENLLLLLINFLCFFFFEKIFIL